MPVRPPPFAPQGDTPDNELRVLQSLFAIPTSKFSSTAKLEELTKEELKEEEIKDEMKDEIKEEDDDTTAAAVPAVAEATTDEVEDRVQLRAARFLPPEMLVDLEADSDVEELINNDTNDRTGGGGQPPARSPERYFIGDAPDEVIPPEIPEEHIGGSSGGQRQPNSWTFDYSNLELDDDESERTAQRFRTQYGIEVGWARKSRGRKSTAAIMTRRLHQYDKVARKPKHGFLNYEDRFEKDAVFRERMLQHGYGPDFRHMIETVYAPLKGPAVGGGNRGKGKGKGRGGKRNHEEMSRSSGSWQHAAQWAAGTAWTASWQGASGADVHDDCSTAVTVWESNPASIIEHTGTFKSVYFYIMMLAVILVTSLIIVIAVRRRRMVSFGDNPTIHRWTKLLVHAWRVRFRLSLWAFLGQHLQLLDPAFSHHLRSVYLPPSGIPPRMSRRLRRLNDM